MTPWITSDRHFGHANIIKYCNRPYKSVEQMDEDLIRRYNNRVKPEDLVYDLGDVGINKSGLWYDRNGNCVWGEGYLPKIIGRLNGKKILILGNHDKSAARMMEFGFDFACEEMVITCCQRRLWLVHRPQRTKPDGIDYVLHGHIHNSTPEERAKHTHKGELVEIPRWNINLSVEFTNYEPVPLEWVVKKKIHEDKQGQRAFA